ncbi:FAD-binding oxidoreductase [Ectothiorhodospiraceae bacterium BW-2]|nr:FAD-binding oxidoreductase [Ectothiorhodospiraceae bacterium BW-2]
MSSNRYLIVGAGLAGTTLALELSRRGAAVTVADCGRLQSTSAVAAGLINPMMGRRLGVIAQFEPLYRQALHFYRQLEQQWHTQFWYPLPQWRLLDGDQQRLWATKWRHNDYGGLVKRQLAGEQLGLQRLKGELALEIGCSGYLDTLSYLQQARQQLPHIRWCEATVEPQQFQPQYPLVWQGERFESVIWCQGYQAAANELFATLPWQSAKGEILTLTEVGLSWSFWLNCGLWLLPRHDQSWRLGANFEWRQLDQQPTPTVAAQLQRQLQGAVEPLSYRLAHHLAGVRASVVDRQPLLGGHRHWPQMAIFNGFGAKGSLQIPHYSQLMAQWLLDNRPLPIMVDMARFQRSS